MPDILENASRIENITPRNVFTYRDENAYSISIKHSRSGRTFPYPLPLLSPAKEFKNKRRRDGISASNAFHDARSRA